MLKNHRFLACQKYFVFLSISETIKNYFFLFSFMAYEYDWMADAAVEDLRAFIDTEKQFVQEEHDFKDKLYSWDYVILHLEERIPKNMTHLIELNVEIGDRLAKIRDFIEEKMHVEIKFLKEEEHILKKLKKDVKHRKWRAVKKDIALEKKEEKRVLRLEIDELKELHSKFEELLQLTTYTTLVLAINKDIMELMKRSDKTISKEELTEISKRAKDRLLVLTVQKQKEEYERLEEYYFIQIHKFVRAYERIFRHLWRKERRLYGEVK